MDIFSEYRNQVVNKAMYVNNKNKFYETH